MTNPQNSNRFQLDPEKPKAFKVIFLPFLITIIGVVILLSVLKFGFKASPLNPTQGNSNIAPMELAEGKILPDFTIKKWSSKEIVDVSDLLKSHKLILINFWATWCGPCIEEMPSLIALSQKYESQGLKVIGLNVDENPEEALTASITKNKINFDVYIDEGAKVSDAFHVHTLPTSMIVGADSKILFYTQGDEDWMDEVIQNQIQKWLNK